MLVLALQFSRGDVAHAEPPNPSMGRGSTQRRRREMDSHSLKTEEKTVAAGGGTRGRDRIPVDLEVRTADSPPVHQQVCLELDRTNDDASVEMHSLERR